jgi:putative selenium metabolism protein SsnA
LNVLIKDLCILCFLLFKYLCFRVSSVYSVYSVVNHIRMATFFRDALLVQLDPVWVEAGNLRVADDKIAAVGASAVAEPDDAIVECGAAVLMPGLVNGHTHLYSALAAGMPAPPKAPRNFHEILKYIWWRLDRTHTLESVKVSGQIGALAALRCGTTTLIDHHSSPNAIDDSLTALESGIASVGCRGVLCYEVTDRNRPGEGRQGLDENERYAKTCAMRSDGQFAAMVGAHASFTVDEETLIACVELAKRVGIGIHIHAAEDPVDERITREKFGRGLIERFQRTGLLDVPGTILGHGTHFSDVDISVVNEHSHITLAHNPSSNMNNGVGYTPVAKFARAPQLGTDGIGADMWREARVAEFKSHDAGLPIPFAQSLTMLAQSSRTASKCLGVKLGVLETGAAADLVLTNYHPATPLTAASLAGHFLFAMGPEYVQGVMIAGTWHLKDGILISCDESAIRGRSVEIAAALHERMVAITSHATHCSTNTIEGSNAF